ncbi:helix-turn-helix domain-containing protein [Psychroflexus tropicus]|uniref:helix-turn-helix domain-containing protein n=1 Tax=Psychroflexus tropicus TaxID=197345 RepID=UPI00036D652E|nr:helix-turn-helix transcriptional regulator [Psychroflexus tropicus]
MINSTEFSARLKKIFDHYDLSASSFADKIDVGRASVSHILSGRNKPSLDFVMKVVSAFEDVELYWLLNGKGNFPPSPTQFSESSNALEKPLNESMEAKKAPQDSLFAEGLQKDQNSASKHISKVIVFYTDGSFEAYQNTDKT